MNMTKKYSYYCHQHTYSYNLDERQQSLVKRYTHEHVAKKIICT